MPKAMGNSPRAIHNGSSRGRSKSLTSRAGWQKHGRSGVYSVWQYGQVIRSSRSSPGRRFRPSPAVQSRRLRQPVIRIDSLGGRREIDSFYGGDKKKLSAVSYQLVAPAASHGPQCQAKNKLSAVSYLIVAPAASHGPQFQASGRSFISQAES